MASSLQNAASPRQADWGGFGDTCLSLHLCLDFPIVIWQCWLPLLSHLKASALLMMTFFVPTASSKFLVTVSSPFPSGTCASPGGLLSHPKPPNSKLLLKSSLQLHSCLLWTELQRTSPADCYLLVSVPFPDRPSFCGWEHIFSFRGLHEWNERLMGR